MNYVVIEDRPSILLEFLQFIRKNITDKGQIYGILSGNPNAELEEFERLKNDSTGSWILVECKVKDDLDLKKLKKDFAWFRSGEIKVLCDFLLFPSEEHLDEDSIEILGKYASIKLFTDMVNDGFNEDDLTIYTTPMMASRFFNQILEATNEKFSPLERPEFLSDEEDIKSVFLYRLGIKKIGTA